MENGLSNSVSGGGATRDQYASELLIKLMAHDSETVTQTNRMTNVFPTEIGDTSLDYSGSEHKKVEVTFSYDTNLPE
jgi:ribosomal protein S19